MERNDIQNDSDLKRAFSEQDLHVCMLVKLGLTRFNALQLVKPCASTT